jgi:hypothetical protein
MNKNSTILGVIIVVLLIIGALYYAAQTSDVPASDLQTPIDSTGTVPGTNGTNANTPQPPANQPVTRNPAKPAVTTGQTAFPTDTAVTITGGVVPNGALTTYWFEYGTTAAASSKTTSQTLGGGYVLIPAPAHISGLRTNTKYYYQLVAENQFGKLTGAQYTFQTTQGTPARNGSIPTVRTTAANGITRSEANLTGTIDPNNDSTLYWFEYGKTSNLGDATIPVSVGAGTVAKVVSGTVPGLDSNTTYYYRINAQNDFGTVNGRTLTFKTSK